MISLYYVVSSGAADQRFLTCIVPSPHQTAEAADGSQCVWCEISSYGFCFDEDQAEAIEQRIPGAKCGDDITDDDDNVPGDDDDTPDDYWKCLKSSDEDSCAANGCVWCVSEKLKKRSF
jgi:hypothetical protein